MKKILITGGAGFLGSHLCTRLVEEGHHVVCLDNFYTGRRDNIAHLQTVNHGRSFELVRHDVVDRYYVEVDEIYHLACPASPPHYQRNPVRTLKTAVIGTMNILELAQQTGARVLIASTSEIYGEPEVHPQREDYWGRVNPIGKRACYDEGKRCGETLAAAYAQHGVETRVVRIFNTYGPRMDEDDGRVVSNFITQALRGDALTLYGDGSQTRSLCFYRDLIEGLVRMMALAHDPGPVNLGNPDELTVREIAELVLRLAGSSSRLEHRPLPPDDPTRRRPDISKARAVLGWAPEVAPADGLATTIEFFRDRMPSRSGNGHHKSTPTAVATS
ncbi:MAG TPA: UDP-glucuronic acid decarboxylase family protein [Kofleriaceae bacterium]|nr:UDP-glucuronic acid decarboxylase family protein [Kofleriaceae bacterium]